MTFIDPITRQRVQRMKHTGDINYDLIGDSAITEEVLPIIGDFSDYAGSGILSTKTLMYGAGLSNELFGTDPHIEHNADVPNLDITGNRADTTRRRVIKRNVDK